MIQWLCPHCAQPLTAPDDAAGLQGECSRCDAAVIVPSAGAFDASRPQWIPKSPAEPVVTEAATPQPAAPQLVPPQVASVLNSAEAWLATMSAWMRQHPVAAATVISIAVIGYSATRWIGRPTYKPQQVMVEAVVRPGLMVHDQQNPANVSHNGNHAPGRIEWSATKTPANAVAQQAVDRKPLANQPAAQPPKPASPKQPLADIALSQDDYTGLAQMATQQYRQQSRMAQLDPPTNVLQRLRSSPNPAVQQMTATAEEALRQYARGTLLDEQAREEEAIAMTRMVQSAFNLGDDSYAIADIGPGKVRIQTLSQHYFDEAVSEAVDSIGNRATSEQLLTRSDLARRQLWERLGPSAERLAGPVRNESPVLAVEIQRTSQDTFDGPFDLVINTLKAKRIYIYRLVARNESGRPLTNVTLALKLRAIQPHLRVSVAGVSDSGLSEPNHYFVPRWAVGETIQLMTGLHWGSEGLRRSHEGELTVWATELKQPERTIRFDANLRAYLGDVLASANAKLDRGDYASVLSELTDLESLIPERYSDLRREVAGVRKEAVVSQQRHDQLVEACAAGRDYSGRWVFGKYSAPFAIRFVTPPEQTSSFGKQKSEPRVAVELYDPQEPTVYRPMLANIQSAPSRRWAVVLNRTFDTRLGIADRASVLPSHTNLLRAQDERVLVWQLADSGTSFIGRSNCGDEITVFPADDGPSIAELFASPIELPELLHPQTIAAIPAELLTTAFAGKPYSTAHQLGELSRGQGDSFYPIAQVFLARDEALGMSVSNHYAARLWSLGSDTSAPKPARGKGKDKEKSAAPMQVPQPSLSPGQMAPISMFRGVEPTVATSDLKYLISWGDYGKLEFWETRPGRVSAVVEAGAQIAAYSDDGRELLLTGSSDNEVTVRSNKGDKLLKQKVAASLTALAASRDGTVVAASSVDKLINFWSLKDQRLLGTYRAAKYPVQQLHFNADGSRVLTVGWVETKKTLGIDSEPLPRVHLEILDTASLEKRYEADLGRNVRSIAVSSDWRRALLGDNDSQIYLWDLAGGREIVKLVGHQGAVTAVTFSPDARFALSGSVDTWVILWGLPSDDSSPLTDAR